MESITGIPAQAMLVNSGLLPTPPSDAIVLDNACGAGVVTSLFYKAVGNTANSVKVVCGDLEEQMVKSVAERIKANGWNAEAKVVDAQAVPFPDNFFTHNLMNFGIQVIPDGARATTKSFRVLKSGGKLGLTSWTSPGWLDTFKAGIPGYTVPPLLTSGPWASKESITDLLVAEKFTDVDVQPVKFEHTDHIDKFLSYIKSVFSTMLTGETGENYEAYMRKTYGNGDFTLTWQAVVVSATKL
ncbi:S-adenosyl-L-methionine-dependent methyltransferase [Mycena sp. CBHHK59/15]|nr:S-adenosyl-L-methionine-dependent methyltransferase [Mycena sp. CBHHK59/15]